MKRNAVITAILLSAGLALGVKPLSAGAASDAPETSIFGASLNEQNIEDEGIHGEIPDDFTVPHVVALPDASSGGKKKSKASIPLSYDSREKGFITSAKDQGETELCWAFAAVSCAETAALRRGYETDPDYSEHHLAYYLAQPVYQKLYKSLR